MARNLTPTTILDAKGSFLKHPERERDAEPSTANQDPLGGPPSYLSKEEKKVWKDVAKSLLPGVAFASDRFAFELLTKLVAKMRAGLMDKTSDMTTMISLFSRFAMTPADRSRVQVEKSKESSLSKFLSRRDDSVQ